MLTKFFFSKVSRGFWKGLGSARDLLTRKCETRKKVRFRIFTYFSGFKEELEFFWAGRGQGCIFMLKGRSG